MEYLNDFNKFLGPEIDLAYRQETIDQIHKNRRLLENELFFDRLLKAIGIHEAHQIYPPRSNQGLRTLYSQVVNSVSQDHHKQSLVYYMLKDIALERRDAGLFAEKTSLPEKYKVFIDGIWCMDRLEMEGSLSYLAEPCLTPTFAEDILYTLCRHCQHQPSLPLQYYHTVSPALTSRKILDAVFDVICHASVTEAYQFSQAQGEIAQRRLFEKLISFVHGSSSGPKRGARATELICLPFTDEEENWFEGYLLNGKGTGLYGARDTVLMRRLALDRSLEAKELSHSVKEGMIDGLNWANLTEDLGYAWF